MKKHGVVSRRFRFLSSRLGLLLCFLPAVAGARADDPGIVRLSYVEGAVHASFPQGAAGSSAVVNMPLFDASVVTTGADGQAEIEFADGSVARLTPNSALELTHLQRIGPAGHTDLRLIHGLAYFELNVAQGQHFTVKMGPATLHPVENSIFRLNLDGSPEATVMQGTVHVEGTKDKSGAKDDSALDTDVGANQSVHLDPADPGDDALKQGIVTDSWDQWNADRDATIAEMAASQTAVRDDSQMPEDPGWNDLDYYGDWYPVEGYGNVWTPSNVGSDWDPFGYGYWGNYSGYGTTWISGYPWGWLPYHCGAWNYFQFGWGWVPGGCGLGWSPVVPVWNTPPGYRLPGWPKGPGIVPSQHRPPLGGGLIAIDRSPGARGANNQGGTLLLHNRGVLGAAASAPALQLDGNVIHPLPRVSTRTSTPVVAMSSGRVLVNSGPHVGVPTSTNAYRTATPAGERLGQPLGYGALRNSVGRGEEGRAIGVSPAGQPRPEGRSTYTPAQRSAPPAASPAPRPASPAPAAHH